MGFNRTAGFKFELDEYPNEGYFASSLEEMCCFDSSFVADMCKILAGALADDNLTNKLFANIFIGVFFRKELFLDSCFSNSSRLFNC